VHMNIIQKIIKENITVDDNGCWVWNGYVRGNYPCISIKKVFCPVHRLSYEMWAGDIPTGLIVRHKCDNPKCVNPDHLELGTHKDNTKDMITRGRNKKFYGEDNAASKISDNQRKEIVRLGQNGKKHQDIAEIFNISRSRVSAICREGGTSKNPRKLSIEQKQLILDLRKRGESRGSIAHKLGITKSTVGYYIWKNNKSK
jgi:transcriptional regulator